MQLDALLFFRHQRTEVAITAFVLTALIFAAWLVIGLAVLDLLSFDLRSDLVSLFTAPVIGSVVFGVVAFAFSLWGLATSDFARPLVASLVACSATSLAVRRPGIARSGIPVLGSCIVALGVVGWPMQRFGLHWIANANDDMANYVLSATHLMKHGLLGPIDVRGVRNGHDFSSLLQIQHNGGSRPGSDIVLASISSTVHRAPYEMFMPTIMAFSLCLATATGALAMQAAKKAWVAWISVALASVSSLVAYGALQQLISQVWGLAIAVCFVAWAFRERLYRPPGARRGEVVVIALVASCFVVAYVELAALIIAAYAFFMIFEFATRRAEWTLALRLWIPVGIVMALILNRYLVREIEYVQQQAQSGTSTSSTAAPLFGYSLVPAALSAVWGLKLLPASNADRWLGLSIAVAIVLLVGITAFALRSLRRNVATAFVVVMLLVLGLYLYSQESDFGLFKLYMYAQPFLIALVAVGIGQVTSRRIRAGVLVGFGLLVLLNLHTTLHYVHRSEDPIDLPDASANELLPKFRAAVAATSKPVVSVTDNPVLGKLEAAGMDDRPLNFVTSYVFKSYSRFSSQQAGWRTERFPLLDGSGRRDPFLVNPKSSRILLHGDCLLVLPSGTMTVLNRSSSPSGGAPLDFTSCRRVTNKLVFVSSTYGATFSEPRLDRGTPNGVAFFQPEHDYFYPGHTFVGFGRYTLMRVLSNAPRVKILVDLSRTQLRAEGRVIPPAAVVGTTRVRFHTVGRGSARLISPWVTPRTIDGARYVLLDLGARSVLPNVPRKGLAALYGRSIPLDPRFLTAYVRNVSLVSSQDGADVDPPRSLSSFPVGLADPGLQYSGFYEDGWVAENSYVDLACGGAAFLDVRANVPPGVVNQHLSVWVNGRRVLSRRVGAGALDARTQVPACSGHRTIRLQWAHLRQLPEPDGRAVSAQILAIDVRRNG